MERLSIKEFVEEIKKEVETILKFRYKTEVKKIKRNNNVIEYGLLFMMEGQEKGCFPSANMNFLYEIYKKGTSIKEIADNLAYTVEKKYPVKFDDSVIYDYPGICDNIIPVLVNAEKNKELLESVPHRTICDLALYYRIRVTMPDGSTGTVKITNELMQKWIEMGFGLMKEEWLFSDVRTNAIYHMGTELMNGCIFPHTQFTGANRQKDNGEYFLTDEMSPMYVLTTQFKTFGAGVITSMELMNEIANKIGDGFYVLPSSIHEVMIIPGFLVDGPEDVEELRKIVLEVNQTDVIEEDFLSDNVYKYTHTNGLEIAS